MHSLVLLWLNDMRVVPRDCFLSPLLGELRKKKCRFRELSAAYTVFLIALYMRKKGIHKERMKKIFFFFFV